MLSLTEYAQQRRLLQTVVLSGPDRILLLDVK
jgi:hypothetical protein